MELISDKSPAAGLQAVAERQGAAMVVIGSSHRSAIGRILVGGTGERLLSGSPVPVAIASAGYAASDTRIHVVGCGFDGSPESHQALAWSSDFARTAAARVQVLSVFEPTLPATLALGGGLPTARLNDVLRAQLEQGLEQATSTLQSSTAVEASLVEGDAAEVLAGSIGRPRSPCGRLAWLRSAARGSARQRLHGARAIRPVAPGGRATRRRA